MYCMDLNAGPKSIENHDCFGHLPMLYPQKLYIFIYPLKGQLYGVLRPFLQKSLDLWCSLKKTWVQQCYEIAVFKVHIFREGHKILRNLHLTFVLCSAI